MPGKHVRYVCLGDHNLHIRVCVFESHSAFHTAVGRHCDIGIAAADAHSPIPGEFMLAFQDPRQAVEWALMLQKALMR